ncbi:Isochorismatase hydrolase [Trichocladium antarcticum]|uniref:Isochorismatase hydrolase n=1 Tax=Trichocladium antarcticum TaxID=1450529 RepID=A0AAN6UMF2_9PEZI|nr:Isochorismatase hydrolase [Trichocladium antarcticum]
MKSTATFLAAAVAVGSAATAAAATPATPTPIVDPRNGVPWERLDKHDAMLVIVDFQEGLYNLARDWDPNLYRDAMMAHSSLATVFPMPVVLTTSAETGPNGPMPQEITDMYPGAPVVRRQGEVNAWDNADFRAAIRAANKTQIIVAGIVTDVCTAFLARSLRAEGYSVWANLEASGTTTKEIRDITNAALRCAGVNVVSLFAIVCDLMRDWRATPGLVEVLPWLDRHMPAYGMVARAHRAAVTAGEVPPGADRLPR